MRRNRAARTDEGRRSGDVTTVVHPSDGVIVCMCTYVMRAHRIRKAVQLLSGAQGPQPTSATKYRDRQKNVWLFAKLQPGGARKKINAT